MKIWFDTTPVDQLINADDCSDDCSGDCRLTDTRPSRVSLPLFEDMLSLQEQGLQRAASLYFQKCSDERWLICNPVGEGQVAIVDASALALLEQFCGTMTLHDVVRKNAGSSAALLEKLVTLFYKLGFLHTVQLPQQTHTWNEPETLSAWLHVTNACNLRCQYCYLDKTSEHMKDDTARRAIDAVFRAAELHHFKSVKLKYAGGEASLYLKHVIELHDYAAEKAQEYGCTFGATLLSNGVVVSQKAIDQLKARRIGVTISLDGIGAYHDRQRPFIGGQGSFKYVDRTITRLLANGIVPHITVTVSQRNLGGLLDLMQYILEREMSFKLSYYRENECSTRMGDLQFSEGQMITTMRAVFALIERELPRRQLLDSLIDRASLSDTHRHTCGVGRNYLVIDQDGGVAKCQMEIQRTITTIDAVDLLQEVRDDRRGVQGLSVEDKEGCRACEWRYWCTGGCPLVTYRATGRYDVKSPNCNIYKALFPEVLRLEALRLLKYELPAAL
jgi:uncharacterized protein